MNGYKAFYKGKSIEVYAHTSLEAQTKAAAQFKIKKQSQVDVYLCEKDVPVDAQGKPTGAGTQVTHRAVD
jgi:hypothetical protein